MYRKLGLLSVCIASAAHAEPVWTRQLPNFDGSGSFVARDGADVVWMARTASNCDYGGAIVQVTSSDSDLTATDRMCFPLASGGLKLWRFNQRTDTAATARAIERAVAADTSADTAPRLPGKWEHSGKEATRLSDDSMDDRAWLDDAATAPACTAPCVRGSEPVHRYTRGHMVLDVPVAIEARPSPQALVTWFLALPEDTPAERPVVVPVDVTPAVAPALAPTATSTVAASPSPAPSPSPPPSDDSGRYHEHHVFDVGSMMAKHYEILFNQNWLQPPVDLVFFAEGQPDKPGFVPVQALGVTIIEHGGGFIGMINAAFLAGAGGYVGTEDTSSGRYDVYNTSMTSGPGPEASWTFNISDQYMGFRADSWWTGWIGWRFGLWSLRQLNTDTTQMMPGPTTDVLARYGAAYLNNAGGLEIELMLRKSLLFAPLGRIDAVIDLPVSYLCAGPFMAAGVLDKGDRGMVYAWGGVPRISADFGRRIGPLMIHAVASIPTMFLVVPLNRGGQLTVSGGFTF